MHIVGRTQTTTPLDPIDPSETCGMDDATRRMENSDCLVDPRQPEGLASLRFPTLQPPDLPVGSKTLGAIP